MMVHDADGNEVADIPISDKQARALEAGAEVAVMFRTPQTLRGTLGDMSGSFTLRKVGEYMVAENPPSVVNYLKAIGRGP